MRTIRQRSVKTVEVGGGDAAPYVVTVRTFKLGTIRFEMLDFELENLATEIAERLTARRNEAIRRVASLTRRVAEAAARGAS